MFTPELATGLELAVAVVMGLALLIYLVTGGADFGGGVLELFARGPRAKAQRELIAHAIGPIWEANHVWMILVVVLLFVCFPKGFAALSTGLHLPLTVLLFGIVLRGSAFVFRSYGARGDEEVAQWSRVFASSSLISPLALGVTAGAVVGGALRVDSSSGKLLSGFVSSWATPFALLMGGLTLALCTFLAAVYLTCEAEDEALQADFRRRALVSAAVVGGMAWLALAFAWRDVPHVAEALLQSTWALPFQLLTGVVALGAIVALVVRRYALARFLAVGQVALILLGWGGVQLPWLIVPDLSLHAAAAPPEVLSTTLWVLGLGSVLLVPSFLYLFYIFKGRRPPI